MSALLATYPWLAFVHVAAVLVFLLLHGGVVATTLALRPGLDPPRARALLDAGLLTFDSRRPAGRIYWTSLAVMAVTGVMLAGIGGFWTQGWPWASAAVLVALSVAMRRIGTRPVMAIRRAAGQPYMEGRGAGKPAWMPAGAADAVALEAALRELRPGLLTATGAGGLLLLLWLMMLKPF